MLQALKNGKFEIVDLSSFDFLCHGKVNPGSDYSTAIIEHSQDLGSSLLETDPALLEERTAIISIPRGGAPTAEGVHAIFNRMAARSLHVIDSNIKTAPESLYNTNMFNSISHVLIADGIIGTGKTVVQHLEQIPADWLGRVTIFSNAASQLGVDTIMDFAHSNLAQPVKGITGRVFGDDECEWVDCAGKNVYFVGYNKARSIDYQLPDFGDHITPSQP